MPPALKALLTQCGGWALAWLAARSGLLPAGLWVLVAAQAVGAMTVAVALRSARWWLPIHLGFTPLVVLARGLDLHPGWYLGAFLALVAVYWTSFRTQVPLYLSNQPTVAEFARLLPAGRPLQVLDLGSGTGTLLRPLARLRPDCRFTGIEAAPAPHVLARLLAGRQPNLVLHRGDFFAESWSAYDVVYAFLSPVPMAMVWQKACRELRADALLVSNSFPVPGVEPAFVVDVADRRRTRLYAYRPVQAAGQARN
ncbi:class I SAM-dependent methyltransferase [Pseudothauera rhizosphaerae]|uniref:Class I SAM-dependent methyltransferase n=1 Tax=Pseudothauera rhizosphaerae TaxID=2565932 RepID=A0A4S4ANW6_9RHOO|nr:class I SAM-dependent methyltransferase [Pseudothauera rhizosphaerae]THF61355.1 class I SAM-dependent methyltransferase [Pseudothauera rhizosphaerae]